MSTKKSVKKQSEMKTEAEINSDEIPFKIPDNWKWVRLSSLADIYTGNSINEEEKKKKYTGLSSGYYYIATKDISFNNEINYDNGVRIPNSNTKFRIAPKNSTLLCIEGGSAGRKIAITNQDVCFVNKLCCFSPYGIDHIFLYYYLQTPTFFFIFKKNINGIIGGVGVNKLRDTILPLPPLEEQKLIVEKIESEFQKIDNALNKLNIIKEQIKQYKQSVLKYAFDENNSFAKGSNYEPYEWEEKILDDVCYINPTTIIPEDFNDDTEVSFLPMANVEACTNNYTENIEKYQKVKKGYTKFQENDILFAKITPCMENGKICVINKLKSKIGFGSTEFHVIRNKDNVFIDFIYYFLSSEEFRMNAKQKMTGAVGQKRVQAGYLINHIIKLPNIELQKTIADNIQNIFDKVDNIENNINENIDKLNVLKQAVLKKAFEGKLI
ncbi:restriction endonuclease subunit S [uncultured Brachyspira sp.]|uniref:restriction endonuclease subunit S n=1 Tax=uncultured Brachyspira sp. TaxID=221953 RepID=UPI00260E19F3|nr:restriction endonuclease subunit S [uncultured Brachyspira sp.]